MYNPNDPRFRRTLNDVSRRLESANETAQVSLFSLSENCLKPCFFSVSNCLTATTDACFPTARRDERTGVARRRGRQGATRGRLERSFDFYDDWDEDENDALLDWGNEEYESLLGNEAESGPQPTHRAIMNYGSNAAGGVVRAIGSAAVGPTRRPPRKSVGEQDPTIIPNNSFFGFLDRLPFKIGSRGLRYKPSAAGLQDRPRLAKESDEAIDAARRSRGRSNTLNSQRSEDSYSSRGDIFPSDEELEDAVPFDDEFAAQFMPDDNSSGKTKKERRKMRRVASSGSNAHSSSGGASRRDSENEIRQSDMPTLSELKQEEQRVKADEEREIQAKRDAAAKLAKDRGLSGDDVSSTTEYQAETSSADASGSGSQHPVSQDQLSSAVPDASNDSPSSKSK